MESNIQAYLHFPQEQQTCSSFSLKETFVDISQACATYARCVLRKTTPTSTAYSINEKSEHMGYFTQFISYLSAMKDKDAKTEPHDDRRKILLWNKRCVSMEKDQRIKTNQNS